MCLLALNSAKVMLKFFNSLFYSLLNCLSDTHPKVRERTTESLKCIGSSVKNPEISEIMDLLIQALSNPFEKNRKGLEVLL